jgi:carbon monoxide dehydrogenase subunit G
MGLQTAEEITVDADRTTAFAFVRDPERLARCIPGCHALRELSPGRYSAVLTSRIAFMTLSFNVIVEVVRIEPPTAIEATITGDAIGLPGHVVATANVELAEAGERRTTIRYATEIALTGRLGGLGQPVFRATSAQMAREFGANLKKGIEASRTETPA